MSLTERLKLISKFSVDNCRDGGYDVTFKDYDCFKILGMSYLPYVHINSDNTYNFCVEATEEEIEENINNPIFEDRWKDMFIFVNYLIEENVIKEC